MAHAHAGRGDIQVLTAVGQPENPAIGIIICKSKDRMVVEYALRDSRQPIGVATYTIKEQVPEKWRNLLPSPEQLEKHINLIQQLEQQQKDTTNE